MCRHPVGMMNSYLLTRRPVHTHAIPVPVIKQCPSLLAVHSAHYITFKTHEKCWFPRLALGLGRMPYECIS